RLLAAAATPAGTPQRVADARVFLRHNRKGRFDKLRQLFGNVRVHPIAARPRRLRGVDIKPRAEAEVVALGLARKLQPARAGVGDDERKPELGGDALRAGLDDEVLLGAGEPREPVEHRHRARLGLRRQKHAEAHRSPGFPGLVAIDRLDASKASAFRDAVQYTTTARIDLPACMRSKPSLMSASFSLCVMRSSMLILPSMYQSTIFGTSRLPFAPPKAVPFHTRPVTSWNGRVLISWPEPATPMITDTPQPR